MTRTLLACALIVFAFPASAQLFKCVQDGKTVYQQTACPETAKQSTLRAPESAPVAPAVQKQNEENQAKEDNADLDRISEVVAGYNICSEIVPEFREKNAEQYNAWGTKNREAFRKYEENPEGVARMKRKTAEQRAKLTGEGIEAEAKKQALCARVLAQIQ